MKSLLLGCGNSRIRKLQLPGQGEVFSDLTTIDMNPDCGADYVMDLSRIRHLPFPDSHFDEIAAYDFLEHIGQQGDWRGFFCEFAEYHRILRPGGFMGILVPVGADAFADPGHIRFFSVSHFAFLSQDFYERALADGQPITDYRFFWKLDFRVIHLDSNNHHISCILQKPDA